MPSTDIKLKLKAKTSVVQTGFQPYVYAKGLNDDENNAGTNCQEKCLLTV
jgi:hypothetical protein